jgi:Rieske Fe-S protein
MTTEKISRRTLGGLAAAGVGVPLLAACGSDDPQIASDAGSTDGPTGGASGGTGGSGGEPLTSTSDIEVGGGAIFPDAEVVVTQPAKGQFKCFTAVCTHQGCLVSEVSEGTINCDCHGSQFSIEDGSVVQGPATFALSEDKISVSGDQIRLS